VLDQPGKLGKILIGMNRALGESEFNLYWGNEDIAKLSVPLTVKFVS
jgi:hypothetical protein